jgi:hypothetical protein
MRFIAGTITIIASGTELPLSTHASIQTAAKVLSLIVRNRSTNNGLVYVGVNGMSTTDGWTMKANEAIPAINFRQLMGPGGIGGSVRADSIYFDVAVSGEKVDFIAVLE